MRFLSFKKIISSLVLVCHTALALVAPMSQANAGVICSASNPTTASGATPGCAVRIFPSGAFAYPKLAWELVGEFSTSPQTGFELRMASGDKAIVDNNRAAAALGLEGKAFADVLTLFPTNVPFVFARYNPATKALFVDIFKIEKNGSKSSMTRAAFTPAHGNAFAASQVYATPSSRELGVNAGANPFALFLTPGDDTFHSVGSNDAVQVVVGHAMRMVNAPVGLVAIANSRVRQWTTTSGSWLKKKTTQHVQGYAKPDWWVVTPAQFQPRAELPAKICAIDVGNTPENCPPELVVKSGVVWTQWTGGNLPDFEDTTSYWKKSQSGFGLLAMVLVIFVMAMVIGPLAAQMGAAGGVAGPATAMISGVSSAGAGAGVTGLTWSAVGAAATEAAFGATVSALAGGNLNGAVDGPYLGASSGYKVTVRPDTPAGRSVYDGLKDAFDTPTIEGSKVRAVSQGAYGVACAPGAPASACGGNSGVVPRSDGGAQTATTQFWRDNGKPLVVPSPFRDN